MDMILLSDMDMILLSPRSGSRDTLAAVTAAIHHNCVASLLEGCVQVAPKKKAANSNICCTEQPAGQYTSPTASIHGRIRVNSGTVKFAAGVWVKWPLWHHISFRYSYFATAKWGTRPLWPRISFWYRYLEMSKPQQLLVVTVMNCRFRSKNPLSG
jgi:hypothetical protein